MYLLKVEVHNDFGQSFKYFKVPENFDYVLILKEYTFNFPDFHNPIVINSHSSNKKEIFEDDTKEHGINSLKMVFENGWKHINFCVNDKPVDIFFDGKAYLIKDNSKTVEMF